ncbi:MAG: transketolase [Nitrospirae bacterium]|uniref:transketolase n=1 Tax=Candidatus Magnetobacterium casense TaxID=1455061 RepID=UPI00058C5544|nr:transketolase [Candidatus Magnetobacterium casensis]MBF0336630.1 transketolase [Nitrospirota bacterium]
MTKVDELCINTIRMLSIDAVQKANSGHPGMPMGDADMAYVLWTKFLRHNPRDPRWHNRDRFILSAGHGSMLLYSLLYLTGHKITLEDIKAFRQFDSNTPGHPEYNIDHGVEVSTGPLGYGFAAGVGMAMAQKYLADLFNKPDLKIIDYNIYAIVSDGDVMEGISYEAASLAGHLQLDKLVYLYSFNSNTIDGSTDLTFTEDVGKRFEALRWHVQRVDGYDLEAIEQAIDAARNEHTMPSMIIVDTHLGYGSPNKQDNPDIHGAPLGEEELRLTKEHFNWPPEPFHVPDEVLAHCRTAVDKGHELQQAWLRLLKEYEAKYPADYTRWKDVIAGKFVDGWKEALPLYGLDSPMVATRTVSGKVLNIVNDYIPQMLGGSADLAPSNMTYLPKYDIFAPGRSCKNIHFGIREFSMAAITTGMALSHSLIPYCGTYLVFSSYMMAAIRMSALMKARVLYILTHDSIGVGEDGPSHHPIEQLTALRAIPDLTVIRPADANETVTAMRYILEHPNGPVALVLTRQAVPVIDRVKYNSHEGLTKGAYILADSGAHPDLIIMASGSEVHLAIGAYEQLSKESVAVRVVSVPSFELFERQSAQYKESVLPIDVEHRIAIEAGATLCWYKYVGLRGKVIGIDRFGISAPSKQLFEYFGLTVNNVLKTASELLKG